MLKQIRHRPPLTGHRSPVTGFSLVEVLIIVSLLAIVLLIGSDLFFTTLKGASKAEIVKEIKQNGNFALGIMERMIRNSRALDCSGTPGQLSLTNPDQGETTFRLDSSNRIASESALGPFLLTSPETPAASFSIICSPSPPQTGRPTVVTVQFRLTAPGGLTRTEETAQVDFQTQVSTRNY